MNFPAFNKRIGKIENKISNLDKRMDDIIEEVKKWQEKNSLTR
jgi:peptidoglycan hydrolase CwlO-like protein